MLKITPICALLQSPAAGSWTPISFASGLLNTLNAYTCPTDRWIASAAGGTSQRLNPGPATVRSRSKNDAAIFVYFLSGLARRAGDGAKRRAFRSVCVGP